MYKQQAALRQQRVRHPAPIRELPEEVPEEDEAAAEADVDDEAQPIWQEEADHNALFYQVESVMLDSELFARFCVFHGHSDVQQSERRSMMDLRGFITMLQSLGVMEDSPAAPTHEALLKTAHRISKTMAASIFRDASAAAKQRKEVSERVSRTGLRGSQMSVAELNFSSFCAATTAVARYLTRGPDKSMRAVPQASIVASTSGLKMERVLQDRPSKKALAAKTLLTSPLKWGMPRELEGYREERRRLLFANLPAGFHCPDAPPSAPGAEEEKVLPEDPVLDRVEHFLLDFNLFLKYCMVEGHSALQSGSRQKSMDLHEFQYMLNEVGALKSGELGRAHGAIKSKPAKDLPAGGDGRIPAIDGLERKLLTRKQCTNCFRAAMVQAKTQALIAAGELNYELYKIAAKFVAKIYVYGEPEAVEEERGGRGGGRTSCPPVIPQLAPAQNTEIYAKILEALPRPRPNGVDELLDQVENLLLDPEVFERFCVVEGHSSLQTGSRRSSMDQHEWFRCLADLGLMPADILKENRIVDPFRQKRAKKEPAAKYPAVVAKLERRLTKEQAGGIFRRALGTTGSSHGAAAGELNFRRYCRAALIAAKWLVHGETKIDLEDDKPDARSTKRRTKAKLFEMRSKGSNGVKSNPVEKSEWNARFHQPDPPAPTPSHDREARSSQVSFNLSTDMPRPSVERVLTEKCLALAQEGDRGMLREEFCARFATRDAYSRHLNDRKGASESQDAVDPDLVNKALRQAVVATLSEVKLIPDFISKEAVTEIVTSDLPEASVRPSTQKAVSFGGLPPQGLAVQDKKGLDPSVSSTGDTPDQPAVDVSTTGRYWPFSAFRHCFDHFAGKVDLNVIKEFLQSPHAWIHNPSASYPGARIPFGLRQRRHKGQAPQTPWTQAHPTAAYRPRTSVRKLMLNQKELRRKHVKHQQVRREKEMRRLEEIRAELEIKQKQEQEKTDRRASWIRTLEAVDAKMHELHRQELLELEQEALLHWNESHEV
jgi:hypothetical protein